MRTLAGAEVPVKVSVGELVKDVEAKVREALRPENGNAVVLLNGIHRLDTTENIPEVADGHHVTVLLKDVSVRQLRPQSISDFA